LVLTRLGLISEIDLAKAVADELSLPLASYGDLPTEPVFPNKLDVGFLRLNKVLPIASSGDSLTVAMADPFNDEAIDAISYLIECPVERCLVAPADFEKAIEALYDSPMGRDAPGETGHPGAGDGSEEDVERLRDIASEAPIIRLVNRLIAGAVEQQASDIHVEPLEDCVRVRFRVDGVLHVAEQLPLGMHAAITSRIKIISKLNIAERRLPQDGRIKLAVRGRDIDFRVSSTPTLHGESVVLRILDRSGVVLEFGALGYAGAALENLEQLLAQPNGIVLVTGPTGSGKTTTLYTALTGLNHAERKIFSVEDPVEYELGGVNQMQVQPKIGLDFATALRSILRQDPDIIMIGEIRDLETAQIAIQASLTGHLVLSTLHTNSALATVARLIDMGVEGYLLAATVTGIIAQRLVRRLCQACAQPVDHVPKFIARLVPEHVAARLPERANLRRPVGCAECRNTGYASRTSVVELLVMDDDIRGLVVSGAAQAELERTAVDKGFRTMFEDGLFKVFSGETSIDEVLRSTRAV